MGTRDSNEAFGEELLSSGPAFERRGEPFDPAQHGFTMVHNYALYFWRPYLGNTAFALWETLTSFCYGDQEVAFPSVSRLARILTNSDHSRAVVTGRHGPASDADADDSENPDNAGAPGKGYPGALARLKQEGLLHVRQRGRGPTARYQFRVRRTLPLLRPDQVTRLSPLLQHDHITWLERYGIDDADYRLAFAPPDAGGVPSAGSEDGHAAPEPASKSTPVQSSTNNPQQPAPYPYWWQETIQQLRPQLSPALFQICLARAQACHWSEGVLTVRASNKAGCDTLRDRLQWAVERTLRAVSDGRVTGVEFTCAEEEGERKRCAH